MIKFIACDMDGTLLNSNKEFPKRFEYVLEELDKRGVKFAISSGRQYYSLCEQLKNVRDKIYIIAENGAMVYDDKGSQLICESVDTKSCVDIIKLIKSDKDLYPVVCGVKSAYGEARNEPVLHEILPYYLAYETVDDLCKAAENDEVLKLAIYDNLGSEAHCYKLLSDYYDSHIVAVSGSNWLDVMKKGVTKGSAIDKLREIYGWEKDECMAFGDFMNDYDMMLSCGESYAMENAHPDLKRICKYIAPSNDDDGVMKVICREFGIEY